VGGGIGDFTYQIILQSLFITKNLKFKNISKIDLLFSVPTRIVRRYPSKHAGIGPVLAEYRHVPAVPYTGERYWASAGPVPANHKLIQPMVVLAVR
jgi:hypothetical protein